MVLDQTLHIGSAVISDSIGEFYPEDPDDDVAVTTRTDAAGATVRAMRPTISHTADSERNGDLTGFDRMPYADRHRVRSSRTGRLHTLGQWLRVRMESARAGEAWAIDRAIIKVSPEGARPRAADTTTRTDAAGATAVIPTLNAFLAADDERDAILASTYGTVQDRWVARLPLPSTQRSGQRFRFRMETSGRAGEAWAVDRLVARVETENRSEWGKVT